MFAERIAVRFSYDDLVRQSRSALLGLVMFAGAVAFSHCGMGCKPVRSAGEVEAEYTTRLLACSAKAKTKAEASACRRAVNAEFGLCEREAWPRITPCDEE